MMQVTEDNPQTDPLRQAPEFGDMPDNLYASYHDERNLLIEGEQDLGRSFDKYLLTLSGGALALSLTLLGDLQAPDGVRLAWTLVVSWILLIITIIQVGAMMRLSHVAHEEYRHILDTECAKGGRDFWSRVRAKQSECRKPHWIARLNWNSIGTFSVGVILLLVFALANVSTKTTENQYESKVRTTTSTTP